jgi:hypothetical protein
METPDCCEMVGRCVSAEPEHEMDDSTKIPSKQQIIDRMRGRADSKGEQIVEGPDIADCRCGYRGRCITMSFYRGAVELNEYYWDDVRRFWVIRHICRVSEDVARAVLGCYEPEQSDPEKSVGESLDKASDT